MEECLGFLCKSIWNSGASLHFKEIWVSSRRHIAINTHTDTHRHFAFYLQWGWRRQVDSPSRGSTPGWGVGRRQPWCHAPEGHTQTLKSLIGQKKTKKGNGVSAISIIPVSLPSFIPTILQSVPSLQVHLLFHTNLLPTSTTFLQQRL